MNIIIWTISLLCLAAGYTSGQHDNQQAVKAHRSVMGHQGIVIPKRSSFIFGLNEQFKPKQSVVDNKNASFTSTQSTPVSEAPSPASFLSNLKPTFLLGSRKKQQLQQSIEQQTLANLQTLYIDRHQQEMLAANPNLTLPTTNQFNSQLRPASQTTNVLSGLLPPVNLAQGSILVPDFGASQIQKSLIQSIPLGDPFKQQYQNLHAISSNSSGQPLTQSITQKLSQNQSQQQQQQPQQSPSSSLVPQNDQQTQTTSQNSQSQLYRGYSLIELDIKSEADRRYMKDLYANLSTVINEQASNPNTSPQVSPYVDVDFWSFGRASITNDQIDVMVSPRSKPFLMAQLAKAKIRYRIKIDDIQARIDRDQASQVQILQQQNLIDGQDPLGLGSFSSLPLMNPFSYSNTNSFNLPTNKVKQLESSLLGRQSNDISSPSTSTASITPSPAGSKLVNESAFFENYQRLQLINQYLEYIVQRDGDVAQVKVIGRSSQGRHLRVLKLGYERMDGDSWDSIKYNGPSPPGDSSSFDGSGRAGTSSTVGQQHHHINATHIMHNFFHRQQSVEKLGSIWLDGGTHAREWISVSTVLYLAFRLSDNHNRCSKFFTTLKSMVNEYEQSVASGAQQLQQQQNLHQRASAAANSLNQMEASLFSGLNDLNAQLSIGNHKYTLISPSANSILTGKQAGGASNLKPRSEMEQMLELIAKNPQIVASEFGCDLEVDQLLRRYTFFIMPVLNPDGYEYSHTHNRLWRKTRSTSNHPIYRHFCLGADPNRNYDAHHGSTGSSSHPCSQTFAGATPFTEPETRHQSNFVYANRFGMKMYISFHSYSQMILLPLSHSKGSIPDLKDLESVGNAGSKAIEATHGTQYRVGQSAAILYTAAGTASDWAYEKANVKYSYTIELRDTGSFGFLIPRHQIIPTGEETFNGLLAMISQMEKNDNLLTSKSTPLAATAVNKESSAPINPLIDYNRASQSDLDRLNSFMNNKRRAQLESVHSSAASSDDQSAQSNANSISSSDYLGSSAVDPIDPSASGGAQATAGASLLGVRDRRPSGIAPPSEPSAPSVNDGSLGNSDEPEAPTDGSSGAGNEIEHDPSAAAAALSPMDPLGQPVLIERQQAHAEQDHDGESGYAFEGEGELLEPAMSSRSASEQYGTQMSGARAHISQSKLTSRRIDSVKRIEKMTKLGGNGRNSINSPPLGNRDPAQVIRRETSGNQLLNNQQQKRAMMISL